MTKNFIQLPTDKVERALTLLGMSTAISGKIPTEQDVNELLEKMEIHRTEEFDKKLYKAFPNMKKATD